MTTAFTFPAFPPPALLRSTGARPQKVIVVGAGLAGLSAAHMLRKDGHEVTILEARDRPGGRVLTLRDNFSPGLHADCGAAYIPGGHTYTVGFAQQFGLELDLIPPGPTVPVDFLDGQLISDTISPTATWPITLAPNEQGKTPLDWDRAYAGPPVGQILGVDPRGSDWPGPVDDIDAVTFAELLAKNGASPGAIKVLRLGYPDLWGDGIDTTSALLVLRDMAWMVAIMLANTPPATQPATGRPAPAPQPAPALHPALRHYHARQAALHAQGSAPKPNAAIDPMSLYRVRGGNDHLPRAFADSLGHAIRYNTPVQAIAQTESGVRITTADGQTYEGDRAIVAASYSCVRAMRFTPALPDAKAQVVNGLRYTSVARVFLEFRERVWVKAGLNGTASTDLPASANERLPGLWIEDATQTQHTPNGILDCYFVGEWARRVGRMSESDRVKFALTQAERVFPGATAQFSGNAMSKFWDEDPWANGDYCWFAPGEMKAFTPQLATAVGRIHFAGCHTSALPGWMQGALESGLRAADEVNAAG